MKRFIGSILFALSCLAITAVMVPPSVGQLIYGNTFPFWNVSGPLTVTGTTTLSGATNMTGATAITGITTSGVAAAGNVGEVLTGTTASTAAIPAATGVIQGVGCVAITPGDWQLQGTALYSAAGATYSSVLAGINTNTTSSVGAAGTYNMVYPNAAATYSGVSAVAVTTPVVNVNLNATTTYCTLANSIFGAGTQGVYGVLNARRMR